MRIAEADPPCRQTRVAGPENGDTNPPLSEVKSILLDGACTPSAQRLFSRLGGNSMREVALARVGGLPAQHSPQGVAPGSGAASAFYPIEHFVRKPTRDSVIFVV